MKGNIYARLFTGLSAYSEFKKVIVTETGCCLRSKETVFFCYRKKQSVPCDRDGNFKLLYAYFCLIQINGQLTT